MKSNGHLNIYYVIDNWGTQLKLAENKKADKQGNS